MDKKISNNKKTLISTSPLTNKKKISTTSKVSKSSTSVKNSLTKKNLLTIVVMLNYLVLDISAKAITNNNSNEIFLKYYDKNQILYETHWNDLAVQENEPDIDNKFGHLSLMSQGKYNSDYSYDNNYYYPASAGKGIDIYFIDTGLDISVNEEDFDTYAGTPDERIVRCEGRFVIDDDHPIYGEALPVENEKYCMADEYNTHGSFVAIAAAGKLNGSAKKANIHMLATPLGEKNELSALTYVLKQVQNKRKNKPEENTNTIVNITTNCNGKDCRNSNIENIIKQLAQENVIIFASAGNKRMNNCVKDRYTIYDEVIGVGGLFNNYSNINYKYSYEYNINDERWESNYGPCINIYGPFTMKCTNSNNEIFTIRSGTSYSSPLVAGVAATIMSDHPEINFNYKTMLNKLQDLALKNIIDGLPRNTPNYYINNGKHTIYKSPRCNDYSYQYVCGNDDCCTQYGYCINTLDNYHGLCEINNGCNRISGQCKGR